MRLSQYERDIIIRALTKVLELEKPHARADEYKKLLDRLKSETDQELELTFHDDFRFDIDDV